MRLGLEWMLMENQLGNFKPTRGFSRTSRLWFQVSWSTPQLELWGEHQIRVGGSLIFTSPFFFGGLRVWVAGSWAGRVCEDGLQGGGESVQAMEDSPWRQGEPLVWFDSLVSSFLMWVGWLQFSMWVFGEEVVDLEEPWGGLLFWGYRSWLWQARTQGLRGL